MLVTGKKTKSRLENILEDLIEAVIDLKKNETPVINVAAPNVVVPEQKPPTIVMPKMPEHKAPIVTVNMPEPKPVGIRCKIIRGNYRDIEYIDIVPIPDK